MLNGIKNYLRNEQNNTTMAFYHYFVNTFIFSVTQLYKYNVTVKSKTVNYMCVTTSKLRRQAHGISPFIFQRYKLKAA